MNPLALFPLVMLTAAALAGCSTTNSSGNAHKKPTKPARREVLANRCPVHGVHLENVHGYSIDPLIIADPSPDFIQYTAEVEHRYPFANGRHFAEERSDFMSQPTVTTTCPRCDAEFDAGYSAYQQLSEKAKEARWRQHLAREAEPKKRR